VQYEFKTSRHYWGILWIAALLSLISTFGILNTASAQPIGAMTGVLGFSVVVIGVFWWALAKGVEEPWEPSLFIDLGALGLKTYGAKLHQLFQSRLVWSGIGVMSKLFGYDTSAANDSGNGSAFAFAFVIAATTVLANTFDIASNSTLAFTVAAISSTAFAVVGAGAFAFLFVDACSFAFVISGTFAATAAGTAALVFAFFVALVVNGAGFSAIAAAAYGISTLGGLGIAHWYRFKSEPAIQRGVFLAALALPWFCTAPIVLFFAGVGLATLFTPLAILTIPPWLAAGLVEFCLVGVSTWLWRWGQNREAMARNPLQGGLIEATLRARYGRPRL